MKQGVAADSGPPVVGGSCDTKARPRARMGDRGYDERMEGEQGYMSKIQAKMIFIL